jgi:hypothetical protein
MIVEVSELVTYTVELPDDTDEPGLTAEDAVCNSDDPWTEFRGVLEERWTEVRKNGSA